MIYLKQKQDFNDLASQPAVEDIGEKAIGLLKIPMEWTPPFLILTTDLFLIRNKHKTEKILQVETLKETLVVLSEKLNELKALGFFKVIVRSSATIETLEDRGNFESVECNNDLNSVVKTIEKIYYETNDLIRENEKNKLALVIQGFVSPRYSGHLSNERRIAKGLNSWSVEYINHTSGMSHVN